VVAILSQSDVVAWLSRVPHALDGIGDATVGELHLGHARAGGVVQVMRTIPVAEALQHMTASQVSAVAVVNEEGELVGNLSASDMRGTAESALHDLALPVTEFLARTAGQSPTALVTVTAGSAFRTAVARLCQCRVHRVWVVNPETGAPEGVITTTDILRSVAAGGRPESR
jgi:CBS domain-containing protein